MYYNKYISKRGGMYHRKRKRSTLPLPSFFFKKSKKIKVQSPSRLFSEGLQAILVGAVWYHMIQSRHITGIPLNYSHYAYFTHLPVTVPTLSHIMGLTGFNATYSPAHMCLLAHILKHSPCCFFCVCFHLSNSI